MRREAIAAPPIAESGLRGLSTEQAGPRPAGIPDAAKAAGGDRRAHVTRP